MTGTPWVVAIGLALAGCGGGGGADDPTIDAAIIDVAVDAPDAEPPVTPACVAPPAGASAVACRECLVGEALPRASSLCTDAVCAVDPSCCDDGWTERCTEVADQACPDLACVNAITMGGNGAVSYARYDGVGFAGQVWSSPLDKLNPAGRSRPRRSPPGHPAWSWVRTG